MSGKLTEQECDALRDYRASQIAAEAERRLRESCGQVPEQAKRGNGGEHESCGETCGDDDALFKRAGQLVAEYDELKEQ